MAAYIECTPPRSAATNVLLRTAGQIMAGSKEVTLILATVGNVPNGLLGGKKWREREHFCPNFQSKPLVHGKEGLRSRVLTLPTLH